VASDSVENIVDHELVDSIEVMLSVSDIEAAMFDGESVAVLNDCQRTVGRVRSKPSGGRYM